MPACKPKPSGAICIVEPDHAVRDGLVAFIELYSEDVRSFSDGDSLRQAWPNIRAAGILCAARLPDVSALALHQWLLGEGLSVPFAVTVSKHQHRDIASAMDAGIFHILHKPLLPGTALVRFIDHTQAVASDLQNLPPT